MPDVSNYEGVIVAKALAYAIALIDQLPDGHQMRTDRDDMAQLLTKILSRRTRNLLAKYIANATAQPCNIAVVDPDRRRVPNLCLVVSNE